MRNRNVQIKLWLNDEEYDMLRQDVKRTGLTQSKYLRALIMKREIREKLPIDYYHMLTEVSRVGGNVNQIARIANVHPEAVPDVARVEYLLRELIRTVHDLTETE